MLRSEPERKRRRYAVIAACIAFGTLFGVWHNRAASHGQSTTPIAFARAITAPFVGAIAGAAGWASRTAGPVTHAGELAMENRNLQSETAALRERVAILTETAASADRIRRDLGLGTYGLKRQMVAEVIGLRPVPGFEVIVINRGRSSGVRVNDVVIAQGGLVGHVFDVAASTAFVLLVTDPNASVGARIQRPESRVAAVCRGTGAPLLTMVYLDRQADVREGDTVVSSGLGGAGGIYPKGIPIGTVVRVADDESGATRQVSVRPQVLFDRLEEVTIVR